MTEVEEKLFEKETWEKLINSPEWLQYRALLAEHRLAIQTQINAAIRKRDFVEAYGLLKAFDDISKVLRLIEARVKGMKGGDDGEGLGSET